MTRMPYLEFKFHKTLDVKHKTPFNVLKFSATGQYLFAGADDGVALIYDVARDKLDKTLPLASPITSAIWHPKVTKTLLIGCGTKALTTISIRDSEVRFRSSLQCYLDAAK